MRVKNSTATASFKPILCFWEWWRVILLFLALAPAAGPASASELRDVSPVTDGILMLHFVDGRAFHETQGGTGNDGRVETVPLDTARAGQPSSYQIVSKNDADYATPTAPDSVSRKSKGRDFVNTRQGPAWVMEHWLYLTLPHPLRHGRTYTISAVGLSSGKTTWPLTFDESRLRSETIHVNQLGYLPSGTQKFAYLSAWLGDGGPLSLDAYSGTTFHVIDLKTRRAVFSGRPTLRQRLDQPDGGLPNEGPHNNYTGADVWQCDFSTVRTPGRYVLSIEQIGCSYPFTIGPEAYRPAFLTTVRGLYHQRCGIALTAAHTKWTRPACHRPETAPFLQTTDRYLDLPHDDGDPQADAKTTGEKRDAWGGWHDAGDWDREPWHIEAAETLLLAYELFPQKFRDGEQNIPESGNGLPDIIDEARWCLDYYRRIQRPDGGVSVGFYESSFPKIGWTAATDPMKRYVYAEDPAQTYRYAAGACRLAWCLTLAGKPTLGTPYIAGARRAWAWAQRNTRPEDEAKVRDLRFSAAAALYRATGEAVYLASFKIDCRIDTPETPLSAWQKPDQKWGAWTYILADRPGMDRPLKARLVQAALHYADRECVEPAQKRAGRYGYNWYVPAAWGSATDPQILPLMVARRFSDEPKYLATQQTTCDYMLGGNPLNMVWVTGLGAHHPHEVMHWDSWYRPEPIPGIVPMGPHTYVPGKSPGAWDPGFAQATAYPAAQVWPVHELWFEDRLCPPTNEFTVGSMALAAAAYGSLCSDATGLWDVETCGATPQKELTR